MIVYSHLWLKLRFAKQHCLLTSKYYHKELTLHISGIVLVLLYLEKLFADLVFKFFKYKIVI